LRRGEALISLTTLCVTFVSGNLCVGRRVQREERGRNLIGAGVDGLGGGRVLGSRCFHKNGGESWELLRRLPR